MTETSHSFDNIPEKMLRTGLSSVNYSMRQAVALLESGNPGSVQSAIGRLRFAIESSDTALRLTERDDDQSNYRFSSARADFQQFSKGKTSAVVGERS